MSFANLSSKGREYWQINERLLAAQTDYFPRSSNLPSEANWT